MTGIYKTLAVTLTGLALLVVALHVFCSTWPAWSLGLVGFLGGNVIVSVTMLTFVKEWGLEG